MACGREREFQTQSRLSDWGIRIQGNHRVEELRREAPDALRPPVGARSQGERPFDEIARPGSKSSQPFCDFL